MKNPCFALKKLSAVQFRLAPAIFRIGYVLEGTPENLKRKAKAVKCNFDFDHDNFEELIR